MGLPFSFEVSSAQVPAKSDRSFIDQDLFSCKKAAYLHITKWVLVPIPYDFLSSCKRLITTKSRKLSLYAPSNKFPGMLPK
jgi:hypothetical protein